MNLLLFWLFEGGSNSSFTGDIDIDIDAEVDVDIDSCLGCKNGVSKPVQVLFHGIEAVLVLTLILVK